MRPGGESGAGADRISAAGSRCVLALIIAVLPASLFGHSKAPSIKGYLKELHTVIVAPQSPKWLLNDLIHNRIDATWQASSSLGAALGVRNRLIYGDLVTFLPDYCEQLEKDPGYWRWSRVLDHNRSYILHSMIDRGYVELSRERWQLRLGRQRINWGMNLLWNPNDLFNSFSYLDFDYEERPGRDAALLTCYTGATSFMQAVYQPARNAGETVIAGLYRFNQWGYDLQALAGRWARDWVIGAGWSGQVCGGAFRGEWTYFYPRLTPGAEALWVASLSADYALRNGLYSQISVLYNSRGTTGPVGQIDYLSEQYLTAKTLTRSRLNGFLQLRYPITPLITADCGALYNPFDRSWFIGPSLAISLSNNLDFLLLGQFYLGDPDCEFGGDVKVIFTRLKWSY